MRIERFSIDGFGLFSGYESGPLNGGVVVFYGPNEAGKTTLLAFIQAILFGFPRRTDDLWFPAFNGGRHGGKIVLCDEAGGRYVVDREHGAHGGPVTVTLPDETQADRNKLHDLLGHASRDVFENVYAFGLDQLQSFKSLSGPEVSSHMYSAGAGAENLPRAISELDRRASEIFLSTGRRDDRPVDRLLGQIDAVNSQIEQKRADAATYASLRQQLHDLEGTICRFGEQIRALNARRAHLQLLRNAWDDWVVLRQDEDRLRELPELESFPQDGLARLQAFESRIQSAEREMRRAQERLDEARESAGADQLAAARYQEALLKRQMLQHARESWTRVEVSKRAAEAEWLRLGNLEQQSDSPLLALLLLGAGIVFAITGIAVGGGAVLVGIGAGAMLIVVGLYLFTSGRQVSGRPKREEQRRRAEAAQTTFQHEQEQLDRWLQQLGVVDVDYVPTALDAVERGIEAARQEDERYRGYLEQVEQEERQLVERESERADARQQLEDLLELGRADDAEDFRRRAARKSNREATEGRQRATLERLQRISGPDEGWLRLRAELETVDPVGFRDEMQALETRLAGIEDERADLHQQRGSTTTELRRLEGDSSAAELRATRQRLIEDLRVHADEWSGYVLAQEILKRARQHYEQERQPAVIQTAQRHFKTITGGRYERLVVPLDSKDIAVVQQNDVRKDADQLSRGTREQLYLALRFGFITEKAGKTAHLPVIVDDILVNFDPRRARATAEAFIELSQTNQVIIFTCHPATVEQFRTASRDVQVVELESAASTTVPRRSG